MSTGGADSGELRNRTPEKADGGGIALSKAMKNRLRRERARRLREEQEEREGLRIDVRAASKRHACRFLSPELVRDEDRRALEADQGWVYRQENARVRP